MIQGQKLAQPFTILDQKGEKRFEEFFSRFSRNGQSLTFSELLLLSIDRNIIRNKIGYTIMHQYFDDAYKQAIPVEKQIKNEDRVQQPGILIERGILRHQFNFLLSQLSYYLYHSDQNHLDRLLNEILTEKVSVSKDYQIEQTRNIQPDEINKRILSEQCIKVLSQYDLEMKNIFTIYMQENLQLNKIMLSWKEISVQNKKLTTPSLIRFLRDADIVPHLISLDDFELIMLKVLHPGNSKEQEFYSRNRILEIYDDAVKDLRPIQKIEGDPQLLFHEFQLLLCRIAFEYCYREDQKDYKKDPDRIRKFLGELIHLRINDQVGIKSFPQLNKKLFQNIEKFQNILLNPYNEDENDDENIEQQDILQHQKDLVQQIALEQEKQIFEAHYSMEQIIKQLEKDLPPLPPIPEQIKQMDKWDPDNRIVIGDPLPLPPPDKNKANKPKPKPKQQARLKPGEPVPRKIVFEDVNKEAPKTSEDYQQELVDKLHFDQKLLSTVERGTMSEIQIIPVLIPEIIYPPNPPLPVKFLIESAICAHNDGNFLFALQNYDEAKQIEQLSQGLELFFEFQKASVYESAGRDDLALQLFLNTRSIGNKLPLNNPDIALSYCGLGLVMYNVEEWEYALRCFLMARQIRERLLGVETIDTATVFNNLGCCMFMLERNQEAYAYFKLSHAILEQFLGPYHTRTMTSARNLMKTNKNYFDNQPAYQKLWVTHIPDKLAGSAKKSKKKKPKKK